MRQRNLKKYSLTLDQFDLMLEEQGFVCAICGSDDPKNNGDSPNFGVDHDHECCPEKNRSCGECIRGLLCTKCNNGLGMFNDNPQILQKAIDYLMKGRVTIGKGDT